METVTDFIFLGSKIMADGDSSRERKRHLLLGRKALTNLDSILKSRDITLLTEFHMVKVMAFPVVMYRCESQTISSIMTELWRSIRELMPSIVMWGKTLRVPWTARRSNQPFLKEINAEYPLEGLMLKLKLRYSGHVMQRANSLEIP